MSIKVKRKKARRVSKIWKEDLERKYIRKEENWETFNLFLNREIGYTPRTRQSIFDIIYDIVSKNLDGLEFKSEDVNEVYFKNGEEDS